LARTKTRVFNTLNQLWKERSAAGTVAQTTEFGYDDDGHLTAINAPLGRTSAQAYDELGRVEQITVTASLLSLIQGRWSRATPTLVLATFLRR
jgi:YD repeat-containing protein